MDSRIDFSHEMDLNIEDLSRRVESYYPDADLDLLRKAFEFARKSHEGQLRSSGEPYIIHPLNVAATLVKLKMDTDSIIAGLLHDVVEDCHILPAQLEENFGPSITQLVVGLTKISKIKFKTVQEKQVENFRKMVVAMAKDIRVIIVKLADRMHNMRTLQYINQEKQTKIAQETLDIYVPLASRLGINSVKADLEDLCLRYLHPEIYYRLAEKVAMKKSERESYIEEVVNLILDRLEEYAVNTAEVTGRSKHFYSIYKKMNQRGVDFDQIQDLLAFRIIVANITECYKALGIIHSAFRPIPGRFKDYIAIPKINNYQSLHTTVIGPRAERIEIQIRTQEMNEVAEKGVAAHWKYKETDRNLKSKDLDWIQELLEYNQGSTSHSEILDVVKEDLDIGGVFVFTPGGDVKELRPGSTPLDFAYSVHTEVGNHCVGAKVNGKIVPLRHRLKSGDTVDILTSKTQTPSKDWLKIVKSSRAKSKIKQWLSKVERDKYRDDGEQYLENALKIYGASVRALHKKGELKKAMEKVHAKDLEELFVHVGSGRTHLKEILEQIPSIEFKEEAAQEKIESLSKKISKAAKKNASKDNAVIVDGVDDVEVRMARCCNPIPGDPILGTITRGRGITIHESSCKRLSEQEDARHIAVEWNPHYSFKHPVNIRVITHDRPGILSQISKAINNLGINIRSAIAKSLPDLKGSFIFEIEVKDFSEFLKVVNTIEAMEEVISVGRA